RFPVLGVFSNVFPDARQQRSAHQLLIGGDGVGDADVRGRIQPKGAYRLLAVERVVVNLAEPLVHQNRSHLVLEFSSRARRGRGVDISLFRSATPPTRRMPGEISRNNSTARARPRTVLAGSCAFSKRMDASVRSLSAEEVLRTEDA